MQHSVRIPEVEHLPIGDGLPRVVPQGMPEYAKLVVVDRYIHVSHGKILDRSFEFILIIVWVDPEASMLRGV